MMCKHTRMSDILTTEYSHEKKKNPTQLLLVSEAAVSPGLHEKLQQPVLGAGFLQHSAHGPVLQQTVVGRVLVQQQHVQGALHVTATAASRLS